jgi:hypothetical protein
MKENKEKKLELTYKGHYSSFTSYYCPEEIFTFAFKFSEYDRRKKEVEKACKKLSVNKRVTLEMNLEFVAYDMLHFGFCMGYVMGQFYNIKDRQYLPKLKKLFKAHLMTEEQKQAERKGLPYIGYYQKNLERRAA